MVPNYVFKWDPTARKKLIEKIYPLPEFLKGPENVVKENMISLDVN